MTPHNCDQRRPLLECGGQSQGTKYCMFLWGNDNFLVSNRDPACHGYPERGAAFTHHRYTSSSVFAANILRYQASQSWCEAKVSSFRDNARRGPSGRAAIEERSLRASF